jgi:type VI secretion system protein ImpG
MLNRTLLDAFRHELRFLREVGAEFAEAYPQYASALATDADGAADPSVERLLEGVAFLTAKTACRLDTEAQRLTEDVLRAAMPDLLYPLPPATMVQLQPNHSLQAKAAARVPRGSLLTYRIGSGEFLNFRSVSEVELLPLRAQLLAAPDHRKRQHVIQAAATRMAGKSLAQCDILRLELSTFEGQSLAASVRDRLPLHFAGPDAFMLWNALTQEAQALVLVNPDDSGVVVGHHAHPRLIPSGWQDHEALLPDECVLPGPYRLLREWTHWPERFAFANLQGLQQTLTEFNGPKLELWWFISSGALSSPPAADAVRLFCTPAVNVERLRCEPVSISPDSMEYPANLPSSVAQSYRILGVDRVSCRTGNGRWRDLRPLHQIYRDSGAEHYAVRVLPRWTSPSGKPRAAELEWLVAPSVSVHAHEQQQADDVMTMDVWASKVSVSELVADDGSGWRLEHPAPVLGVNGVGYAVAGQPVPLASAALLRSAMARFDQLVHSCPPEAAQTLQRWLSGVCEDFFLPSVQGLKAALTVRCAPGAIHPVYAQGLLLTFDMDPLTVVHDKVSGWLHIIAATLARQMGQYAFVMARCHANDRQLAECVVWR